VNVLYGIRIPTWDGKALDGTEFANMLLAYEALPSEIKTRLEGMTATHNIESSGAYAARPQQSAMTDEQRRRRPPVVHPLFPMHPITGKRILIATPVSSCGSTNCPSEGDKVLEYLFAHQPQPQFRWTNVWANNDLLVCDHLGTLHRALVDYDPDEIRLIRHGQVMVTKVFDPEFLCPVREAAAGTA
jgi:taurine dioxygenase